MNKKQLLERWNSIDFINSIQKELDEVFIQRKNNYPCDFRGIRVGYDTKILLLENADFQKSVLTDIDFTYSKMSCSFIGGEFLNLIFNEVFFDSCRMSRATFKECHFQDSNIRADMEASIFENCSFDNAKFIGKSVLEYGGRRVVFNSCSFKESSFKKVEFRASKFIDCNFEEASFDKCDLRGVKFINHSPNSGQLVDCLI